MYDLSLFLCFIDLRLFMVSLYLALLNYNYVLFVDFFGYYSYNDLMLVF